jgi:hypothetical protein
MDVQPPLLEYASAQRRLPLSFRLAAATAVAGGALFALLFLLAGGSSMIGCFADPPFQESFYGAIPYYHVREEWGVTSHVDRQILWPGLAATVGLSLAVVVASVFLVRRIIRF